MTDAVPHAFAYSLQGTGAGPPRQATDEGAAVDWWMAGLAVSALVGLAAWDVGRPGRASAPALMALRAVGGLGLTAMAALALAAGSAPGALIAAVAAAPLLIGLTGGIRRPRAERAPIERPEPAGRPAQPARPTAQERRAA